jgi:hypothetical protein
MALICSHLTAEGPCRYTFVPSEAGKPDRRIAQEALARVINDYLNAERDVACYQPSQRRKTNSATMARLVRVIGSPALRLQISRRKPARAANGYESTRLLLAAASEHRETRRATIENKGTSPSGGTIRPRSFPPPLNDFRNSATGKGTCLSGGAFPQNS